MRIISHLAAARSAPPGRVRRSAAPPPLARLTEGRPCLFGCKNVLAKSDSRHKCRRADPPLAERAAPCVARPWSPVQQCQAALFPAKDHAEGAGEGALAQGRRMVVYELFLCSRGGARLALVALYMPMGIER